MDPPAIKADPVAEITNVDEAAAEKKNPVEALLRVDEDASAWKDEDVVAMLMMLLDE